MAFSYEVIERRGNPSNYPPIRVEDPSQRHDSWAEYVSKAQVSVTEGTMLWSIDGREANLVKGVLAQAAGRGIDTTLHFADIVRLMPPGKIEKLLPQNPFSAKLRDWRAELGREVELLRNLGIKVNINNPSNSMFQEMFPWIGTDHRKNAVVDSRVAWLKDYNYGKDDPFNMLTYSLRAEDPGTVRAIEKQNGYSRWVNAKGVFVDNRPASDLVMVIEGQPYNLLMDRGDPGVSVMMAAALDITKVSGPAIHANQYAPTGRMARAIKERAKAEQPTLIITSAENDPQVLNKFSAKGLAASRWADETADNPYIRTLYHQGKVHSKAYLVLTRRGVIGIMGTNNFNDVGILAGTQENGLLIHAECALGNELWLRHLGDARRMEGRPAPYAQTRYEEVYNPEAFRNTRGLQWN